MLIPNININEIVTILIEINQMGEGFKIIDIL